MPGLRFFLPHIVQDSPCKCATGECLLVSFPSTRVQNDQVFAMLLYTLSVRGICRRWPQDPEILLSRSLSHSGIHLPSSCATKALEHLGKQNASNAHMLCMRQIFTATCISSQPLQASSNAPMRHLSQDQSLALLPASSPTSKGTSLNSCDLLDTNHLDCMLHGIMDCAWLAEALNHTASGQRSRK